MGEARRNRRDTARFIQDFPDCCICGGARKAVTREHMPPKSLFDNKHRPDKLVMPACDICNSGTSTADLVTSMISRWDYGNTPNERNDHTKLAARIKRQAPEIVAEWLKPIDKSRARAHLENHGVPVPTGAALLTIGPMTIRQLNLFAHKAVLCLYFEHFKKIVSSSGAICAYWRSKEDFARGGVPPMLLDLMKKYGTLEQGKWNAHETFEYRYELNAEQSLFACLARLRGRFYITGFATNNFAAVTEGRDDWISPNNLLEEFGKPSFEKRH